MRRALVAISLAVVALLASAGSGRTQPADDFFKGKQIRFVLGAAPGQDYDVWARFLARHLPRHIPGAPGFVVQNMPGAGHLLATNWLYNVAPRDGTVWGSVSRRDSRPAVWRPSGPKLPVSLALPSCPVPSASTITW